MTLDPSLTNNFYIASPPAFSAKLQAIRSTLSSSVPGEAPMKLELRTDFDKTLTAHGSTWENLYRALPEEGRAESQAERLKNLDLQRQGALPIDDLLAWSTRELKRHVKYGTHNDNIAKMSQYIVLRDGAKELFDYCAAHNIERHIISAGITNTIAAVARLHGLDIDEQHIIANTLHTSPEGVVIHWDEDSMVHTRNKHVRIEEKHPAVDGQRRGIIVLGDSLEDAHMAEDNEKDVVIRVRTAPDAKDDTAAYLTESWKEDTTNDRKGFDVVLRSPSIVAMTYLLEALFSPGSSKK